MPAGLAALATLQVTWIYNEFFWATVLMQSGDKFPITSSLNNLRGQFFTDYNLLSAGSILVAIPVLIVFFLLQKQFVAGLTLGATKGCPPSSPPARRRGVAGAGRRRRGGGAAAGGAALGAGPGRRAGRRPGRSAGAGGGTRPSTGRCGGGCCLCRPTAGGCGPGWPAPGPTGAAGRRGSWSGRSRSPATAAAPGRGRRPRGRAGPGHAAAAAPLGVLEAGHTLRNLGDGPYLVSQLAVSLPLPARAVELLDLTGRWCRERIPQRHPLPHGAWVREGRHGRTGHDATVLAAGSPGSASAPARSGASTWWSGDAVHWAERNPDGHAGIGAAELLGPSEVALGPPGVRDPARVRHLQRRGPGRPQRRLPPVPARPARPPAHPRPVVLNTWEAVYFDHRLERLTDLADVAARLGVERFVLDDGWFGNRATTPPASATGTSPPTSGRTASTR